MAQHYTDEEKASVRMHSPMSAFTFYLDDVTKLEVLKKLRELGVDGKKGSLAATIRVLLSIFAQQEDVALDQMIAERIKQEYLFTTKKNKRSSM